MRAWHGYVLHTLLARLSRAIWLDRAPDWMPLYRCCACRRVVIPQPTGDCWSDVCMGSKAYKMGYDWDFWKIYEK